MDRFDRYELAKRAKAKAAAAKAAAAKRLAEVRAEERAALDAWLEADAEQMVADICAPAADWKPLS